MGDREIGMVERAGKALFDSEWLRSGAEREFPGKAPEQYRILRKRYEQKARAVIEAMREMTDQQIRAAQLASADLIYEPTDGNPDFELECKYGLYAPEAVAAWQAAIDAALSENPEPTTSASQEP